MSLLFNILLKYLRHALFLNKFLINPPSKPDVNFRSLIPLYYVLVAFFLLKFTLSILLLIFLMPSTLTSFLLNALLTSIYSFSKYSIFYSFILLLTHSSGNCLDIFFTYALSVVDGQIVQLLGGTYHSCILFKIHASFPILNQLISRTINLYSRTNWNEIEDEIADLD